LEVRDVRSALDPGAAAALVADGATVMIGGFMGVGSPHRVIAALVERGTCLNQKRTI
jgi:acetate CoA/acetoacetate CoA-transferase alpha subunit